ncbi:hypothetical protein HMPREF0682_2493 [Propionibacterium acidifaciens F0233]|uniref:Uncharacterized protein n=1 Tax=Propionibacterium acidifaciens F0233 TaxID=553198 RepID=U2RAC4_9ACTN|nr:hypothetical protein HMPREF0682_2493 [Propionibacterium acidifaciens F0233]
MEPGHEDREYRPPDAPSPSSIVMPQWSPVMKTGNTQRDRQRHGRSTRASMEPGHEDREYHDHPHHHRADRRGLNGARS